MGFHVINWIKKTKTKKQLRVLPDSINLVFVLCKYVLFLCCAKLTYPIFFYNFLQENHSFLTHLKPPPPKTARYYGNFMSKVTRSFKSFDMPHSCYTPCSHKGVQDYETVTNDCTH